MQYVNLNVEQLAYPGNELLFCSFHNEGGYNAILTSLSFYKVFKSNFALVFQVDSIIRHKIPDHLFQYQYIGAPWPHSPIPEGNQTLFIKVNFQLNIKWEMAAFPFETLPQ